METHELERAGVEERRRLRLLAARHRAEVAHGVGVGRDRVVGMLRDDPTRREVAGDDLDRCIEDDRQDVAAAPVLREGEVEEGVRPPVVPDEVEGRVALNDESARARDGRELERAGIDEGRGRAPPQLDHRRPDQLLRQRGGRLPSTYSAGSAG